MSTARLGRSDLFEWFAFKAPLHCIVACILICCSSLHGEPFDLAKIAKQLRPAIVLICVSDNQNKEVATGTGFFISDDGLIVTNCHVVDAGQQYIAKSENGAFYVIDSVIRRDQSHDLAILKAKVSGVPFLVLGKAASMQPGDPIGVVGSPLGLEGTVSNGVVSAVRGSGSDAILQITAPISPGSSGSPVVNADCEVVGVASATLKGGQNLNIAKAAEAVIELRDRPVSFIADGPAVPPAPTEISILDDPDYKAAKACLERKDEIHALKLFNQVAKRFPNNPKLLSSLGWVYNLLGLKSDAVQAYRQSIKLEPDNFVVWGNIALVYAKLNESDLAVNAAKRAIELGPDHFFPWRAQGVIYLKLHQVDEAVKDLQQAVKLAPDDPLNWEALVYAYKAAGRFSDASAATYKLTSLEGKGNSALDSRLLPDKSNKESAVNAKGNNSGKLRNASLIIANVLAATEQKDAAAVGFYFAPTVQYFDYGKVSRAFVVQDFTKTFKRWPKYSFANLTPITLLKEFQDGSITVSFNYDFRAVSEEDSRWSQGSTYNTVTMKDSSSGLRITAYKQKVFNRSSNLKPKQ